MKNNFCTATFLCLLHVGLFLGIADVSGETWTHERHNIAALSVAWGDGQFVVVGKSGTVRTYEYSARKERYSLEWQRPTTDVDLSSIAWGKESGYVVLGDSGKMVFTSTDGVDWAKHDSSTPSGAYFVSYGGGKYFAYSTSTVTYYSVDGAMWEPCDGASRLVSVAYGNGVYVGVGFNGKVYTSTNGVNWDDGLDISPKYSEAICLWSDPLAPLEECAPHPIYLSSMAYGNGIFLAGGLYGAFGRSNDGKQWEFLWDGDWWGDYHQIIHDNARFIVSKDQRVYFTANGESFGSIYTAYPVSAMASNGSTKIVAAIGDYNESLIILTKDTTSFVHNPSFPKSTAKLSLRQSGKTLVITLPSNFRHNTRPDIALYSVSGRKQKISPVFTATGSKASLSTSHIPSGLYLLRIIGDKESWQGQVVIKR